MVVVIDPQIAGVSGDMLLCSLVDMGADRDRIIDCIRRSEKFFPGRPITRIGFERIQKHRIMSTRLVLETGGDADAAGHPGHGRKGSEIKGAIAEAVREIGLSDRARALAVSCIDRLILSESRVHGIPEDSVQFHEASGIDTLVDIVGVAVAMDDLGLFDEEVVCMPVAVGSGSVTFSHGTMSNPAGAILEIFKGSDLAIRGSPADGELATPTGACILRCIATRSAEHYPPMRIASVGYGAGRRDFEAFANVLKVVRGPEYATGADVTGTDHVKMLETNVDDVSGEILGDLIEKAMAGGAKDVSVYPGITKKGRPTSLVRVMCDDGLVDAMIGMLVRETGTLGVRICDSERLVVPRSVHSAVLALGGSDGLVVRYKRSYFGGESHYKIEFDDLKRASAVLGKPIRTTEPLLRREIEMLEGDGEEGEGGGGGGGGSDGPGP